MSGEEDIDYEDEIEQRKNDVVTPGLPTVGPTIDPRNTGY